MPQTLAMNKTLHIELGGSLFEGVADRINEFMGEDFIGRRNVATILNKKQDRRVELVLYDLSIEPDEKPCDETKGHNPF